MQTKRDTTVDLSRCSIDALWGLYRKDLIGRGSLYKELCARHPDSTVAEVSSELRERDTLRCLPVFDTDPYELRAS